MIKLKESRILKKKKKDLINIKNQYKSILIKSIIHNRNLIISSKLKAFLLQFFFIKKNNQKICFLSGQRKSINSLLKINRHNINKMLKLNKANSFKIKSW